MKCPHCSTADLVMSDRQGVEIDYCPQCRGVWLDRGELDKILERSARLEANAYGAGPTDGRRQYSDDDDEDDRRRYAPPYGGAGNMPGQYPPPKKKSFWSELFD